MCNLYSNTMAKVAMRQLFSVSVEKDHIGNAEPLPAIFPKGDGRVVRLDADGVRELTTMHWGFVLPQKSKRTGEPIQPKAVNNARDDKVRTSSFWRNSFHERRCLIPGTSFCEAKGRAPATYHWFSVIENEQPAPFAFAGLWLRYRGPYAQEHRELNVYTMLTTRPNALVCDIHPERMPVILNSDDYETWLTGTPDEAFALARPYPAERMKIVGSGEGLKSEPNYLG